MIWDIWVRRRAPALRVKLHSGDWMFAPELSYVINERLKFLGWSVWNKPPDPNLKDVRELSEGRDPWRLADAHERIGGKGEQSVTAYPYSFDTHFTKLHLLPSAPKEVVDASFKALQRSCHPDMPNGSLAASQSLSEAYQAIYQSKGW